MVFKLTSRKTGSGGFTLPELMVTVVIGCVVLFSTGAFFLFNLRAFAAMSNYAALNSTSRNASDIISRDIRCASSVVSAATNQLVLNLTGGQVSYLYNRTAGTLTRIQGSSRETLLTAISSLRFSLYQRPLTNSTFDNFPATTNVANAKLVAFQWSCALATPESKSDSQSVQMALVDLRNE